MNKSGQIDALPFRIIKSSNEKKRTADVAHNSPNNHAWVSKISSLSETSVQLYQQIDQCTEDVYGDTLTIKICFKHCFCQIGEFFCTRAAKKR